MDAKIYRKTTEKIFLGKEDIFQDCHICKRKGWIEK